MITAFCWLAPVTPVKATGGNIRVEVFGDILELPAPQSLHVPFEGPLTEASLQAFHQRIAASEYRPLLDALLAYRSRQRLNDWLYYQLIRRTAQQLAPKAENYYRYTLYKWFLLVKSGYDATLNIHNDQLLFYVYSRDEVYNIPLYQRDGRQYVCLNIHDYVRATDNFHAVIEPVDLPEPQARQAFSYEVTRLPDFNADQYREMALEFPYGDRNYHFTVKVNPQVQQIFANYPIVDYGTYFNIPVSHPTYQSLVPHLRRQVRRMNVKNGVDYLMKFTRYAFLYEDDQVSYGKEKRMGPEETLLSPYSDCDDRAALFFFLVKEIYNLPMIALLYEDHVTIAVQFRKGYGQTVVHEGRKYSICEPTPQATDLSVGYVAPELRTQPFQVVYTYRPQ